MAPTRWLSQDEQQVWRSVVLMQEQLTALLERELLQNSGLSLPDYAVLVTLSEAPDCTLQSRDIAVGLAWEKSRLSHQVRRMESRGLVERVACPTDARAAMVRLTKVGSEAINAAAPGHVDSVRASLFDPLTASEASELGRISKVISDRIQNAHCGAEIRASLEETSP